MNTREQVINYVRHLVDLTFLDDEMRARPTKVQTAVSTTCNLKCPLCLRESMGIRENLFMDFGEFERKLPELEEAACVSLFGLGEPFLHPRFFEFVEACKARRISVATSTHGMSLTPEVRERLVAVGLDDLHISMDGTTRAVFERLRAGAKFDTVVEQVTALAALKRERGVDRPRLNVNMTLSKYNVRQAPAMARLAHRMGCQSVSYSSAVAYKPEDEDISVLDTPIIERMLQRAKVLADRLGLGFSFWRQKAVGYRGELYDQTSAYGCVQLNGDMTIERNGRMKMCCYIEEDIEDVWGEGPAAAFNGPNMRAARRKLREGRVRTECQGCLYLRERTPFWVQSLLNEAQRVVTHNHLLTEEDRAELRRLLAETQARKDAMWPEHGGGASAQDSAGAALAHEVATVY
ncbi:MAG TPA: radical SAM protein [Candidatus Sumerlaeota bacterium]|nr:radical SAM protein [Candidatus Sumerlaeota bacterium]